MDDKDNEHGIPLITIEKYVDNSDNDDEKDEEDDNDCLGEGDTRQRLLRRQNAQQEPDVEDEDDSLDEVIIRGPPRTTQTPPTPAPRTSLIGSRVSVPLSEVFEEPSDPAYFADASEPPLPPREPTAAARVGSAALVSPPRPARPPSLATSSSSTPPSTFRSTLPWTRSKPKVAASKTYPDKPRLPLSSSSSLPKPRTSSLSLSAASSSYPSPVSPDIPPPPRLSLSSRNASTSSGESAPPLPPKKQPQPTLFSSSSTTTGKYRSHAAAGTSKPPLPSTSAVATAAARARRGPPLAATTTSGGRGLKAVPPAPERDSVTVFPLLSDSSSLYEPLLRRKASDRDEYLDTDDLKALVHTELPSTRRRKTVVTEKTYAETGPYYRLTKAAAATFGWLYSSRDDYDVTRPLEEDEPDPQDALRVWDLAETILHKDGVFAQTPGEPAGTPGSETSGGSRASSQRTFSDRMRRMTCTYEPNTNLHTRMVVRRASTRRDTSLDAYSAPKSSAASQRLSKPGIYVRPYAVTSVVGFKDRSPSPLTVSDIGSGQDFIESGGSDVERGEIGGFMGPAAYDPVSPDVTDFSDKTQVRLLR